jgi:DNA-binding ferritin-like protein
MTNTAENDATQEGIRVIWHSPTEYDALSHGPPYLPSRKYEPVVLSSADRLNVRAFVKSAALPNGLTNYTALLGLFQGAALVHQTHHWSCRGSSFFADHLLFERIYNESLSGIDQLAERAIGQGQPLAVSAKTQAAAMQVAIDMLGADPLDVTEMVQRSLSIESLCLSGLTNVLGLLESTDQLSPGTSNLLEGLADTHETFVYLLKQRAQTVTANVYSYRR